MTYKGHVENGVVVLDDPVEIENGTPVEISVPVGLERGENASAMSFAEYFADVMGSAQNLPSDVSEHHDYYLYGVPKQ